MNADDPTTTLLAAASALRAAAANDCPGGRSHSRSHVRSTRSLAALIEAWCVDWAKANADPALAGLTPEALMDDKAVLSALGARPRDPGEDERKPRAILNRRR